MADDIVGQAPEIEVRITAVVEREYRRRDVFPKLRSEHALRIIGGIMAVHMLSIEEAEALLSDAEVQLSNRCTLRRGMPVAFSSLREKLQAALKHAKGLWDDPGIDVARQRMEESPARFQVGDRVRWYSSWIDNENDGMELEIVGGYSLHKVCSDKGKYVAKDGGRVSYRWGYLAKARRAGDDTYFYSAFELQRMDYSRGHLRLVGEQPAKIEGWRRQG